ncbi:MAG: 4-hydroxybenzoate octaprenyltransferase [Desulfobacteraceae bacterium]|nr:MAG: 4-hydroxybenzoate octaprenyltransferase [Desulfobacteraceae bacterium]
MNEPVRQMLDKVLVYGRMIKFSHSVFALPFVLSAVVLAGRTHDITLMGVFWIIVAAVSARSAAMGFNRIVDESYDRANPRTRNREIPSGQLSKTSAIWFVLFFSLLFVFAAGMLGRLCLWFSVPVLLVLFGYSFTKRFTRWCHVYLGFAISLAPLGAWIAITDSFSSGILSLSLALLTYIAGFDIIYACQDTDFDKSQNLFSLPSLAGVRTALFLSSLLHVLSFVFFLGVYFLFDLGPVYLATVLIIGALFIVEHRLVNPDDLKHIHVAFFHVNSVISVLLFAGILADEVVRRWS